ncbi:CLUMA_CG016013, isoform A [Clunio marinus]|uniref:CLUMA_CG016013, isoform A n=1 Tax=Clunio marinus TaxID=568069 RepID=A0A1J1IWK4_9DIPT|nr:CLUMA_CG016013, isoform A [Clunio marinus]
MLILILTPTSLKVAMRKNQSGKTFKTAFCGFVISFVAVLILDLSAMSMFIIDCLRVTSTDGLMELLEIHNPNEVRSMFDSIPFERRLMPSLIMTFFASKGILLIIINVILMSILVSIVSFNQKQKAWIENYLQQRKSKISHVVGILNSVYTPD